MNKPFIESAGRGIEGKFGIHYGVMEMINLNGRVIPSEFVRLESDKDKAIALANDWAKVLGVEVTID